MPGLPGSVGQCPHHSCVTELLDHLPVGNAGFDKDTAIHHEASGFIEGAGLCLRVEKYFAHAEAARFLLGGVEQLLANAMMAQSFQHAQATDLAAVEQAYAADRLVVFVEGDRKSGV